MFFFKKKLFFLLGNAGLFLVDEEEDLRCLWESGKAKKTKSITEWVTLFRNQEPAVGMGKPVPF